METSVEGSTGANYAAHRAAMDHFLLVAKVLVRARSAALMLGDGDVGSCIAHIGLNSGNVTFRWPRGEVPYKMEKTQIVTDLTDVRLARGVRAVFGEHCGGTFIRTPVIVTEDHAVSMLLNLPGGVGPPSKAEMRMLDHIAKKMADDVAIVVERIVKTGARTGIAATYDEMVEAVTSQAGLRTLLDEDLKVVAISPELAKRFGETPRSAVGKSYFSIPLPISAGMAHLYRHALEAGISTPEVELSSALSGEMRQFKVRASPIRPAGHGGNLLDITLADITDLVPRVGASLGDVGFEEAPGAGSDAAADFLFGTLVPKRTIRSRGKASYVTVRAWRKSIKQFQITALRAIKQDGPSAQAALARLAGAECASEVDRLVGTRTFKYVVPIPCGHSPAEFCFSVALARVAAARLDLPLISAFAHLDLKGKSHPKTNVSRPTMKLVQSVPGPALLIDDVATSGAHLAEAAALLAAAGTETFALAWIGGDSS